MNLKKLKEKREQLRKELKEMLEKCAIETRALTEEEKTEYENKKAEMNSLEQTIRTIEEELENLNKDGKDEPKDNKETVEEREIREFAETIRGLKSETRANNMTKTDNGDIIPTTIAQKILKAMREMSPIYDKVTKYNVAGTLTFPKYDETETKIQFGWADEFVELQANSGKFKKVTLGGFLAAALSKISISLINNTDIDLVNFVVKEMAEAALEFIEEQLIKGTSSKTEGAVSTANLVTTASSTAITADELISLQMKIHTRSVKNAIWIMSKNTYEAIRKLKNSQGDYMLVQDLTKSDAYRLLGNPVYVTDAMEEIGADKTPIIYGDFSGIAMKTPESSMKVQLLREKFATEHALGVMLWYEFDCKVLEEYKIAKLVCKSAG